MHTIIIIIIIIIIIRNVILDVPCTAEPLRSDFEPENLPLSIRV
jgi:hypothetical protein